jgi:3D (Asp-Asp-Asp) domain-containing protein
MLGEGCSARKGIPERDAEVRSQREFDSPPPLMIRFIVILLFLCSSASADYTIRLPVTAYCPCKVCCGSKAHGVTASGKVVRVGMVAGPRSIPFGTKVFIPGAGWRTVEDRLAERFDRRIDLYCTTHSQAKAWGIRTLNVKVLVNK